MNSELLCELSSILCIYIFALLYVFYRILPSVVLLSKVLHKERLGGEGPPTYREVGQFEPKCRRPMEQSVLSSILRVAPIILDIYSYLHTDILYEGRVDTNIST